MRTYRVVAFLLCLLARSGDAQAVRFDQVSSTTSAQCVSGRQCPILALPGTQVNFCGGTVTTLSTCLAAPATTYTDAGAGTPCATTSQLTPQTGGACLATADAQGGYGAWLLPGSYNYFLRVPTTAGGGTYGPYPISVGSSAGCPEDAACDANFLTLAAACTAAGSATLYVTRNWNALVTATYTCAMTFLGPGRLKPASGQTVTLTGSLSAGLSQIFDTSAGGVVLPYNVPILYPQWWGDIPNNTNTDHSTAIQAMVDAAHAMGGGTMYFTSSNGCHMAQNVTYYSNETFDGDKTACVKKPGANPGGIFQIFTSANGSGVSGAQPLTNVHFRNFTIDGNQANQGGLATDQNGLYGIFMAGCSNCSIEGMTIQNNYTDGIETSGYGIRVLTGTADTSVNTVNVSGVTWIGGIATYTTDAHGLVTGAPVIVASVNPTGYNFTSGSPCFVFVVSTTTFTCSIAMNPGAYVSGGTVTSYAVTSISGTGLQNLADGATLTISSVAYAVNAYVSATSVFLSTATSPGNQSGAAISTNAYIGVGNNLLIQNNLITQNRRNNISVVGGPNTRIIGNHLSYAGLTDCSGVSPMAGVDREPFFYGAYLNGYQSIGNEIDHNCGNGEDLYAEITFDPADSPILSDYVHDNVGIGSFNANFEASTGILKVGGTMMNNGGVAGITMSGWTSPVIDAVSIGSARGILLSANIVNAQFGAGASMNGNTYDISLDGPHANAYLSTPDNLAHLGVQAGEEGSVQKNMLGSPISWGSSCIPIWLGTSGTTGRIPAMSCFGQIYSVGGSGASTSPGIGVTDGTNIGKLQYSANAGAVLVGSQNGIGVCLFADNQTGSGICIDDSGTKFQVFGIQDFANNAAAVAGGLTQRGMMYRITGADTMGVVH